MGSEMISTPAPPASPVVTVHPNPLPQDERSTWLRHNVAVTALKLRELEKNYEEAKTGLHMKCEYARHEVELASEAKTHDKAQQRAFSAGTLGKKHHVALHEAEQRCRTLQTEHEEAVAQGSSATASPQSMSPRGAHAATPRTGATMTDGMGDSSVVNAVASPHVVSSHAPTSPDSWGATHSLTDLALLKERDKGNLELRSFYLQMLPLLRGVAIGVYRKASQRFEPHQLHISSDLQRLEIRPVPSS